jgi:transposase
MVPALLPVCPETIDQQDWRRLDERIAQLATEIEALARSDSERLTSVPGVGPLISSVTVAAIANGEFFSKGRDFAAWLGRAMSHVRERSGGHPTLDEGIAANHARADQLYALRRGSFLRFARALFQPEGWNRSYPKPITLGGGSITR